MKNENKKLVENVNNSNEKLLLSDVMNSVGEYPWLTIEICDVAKSNDDADVYK